MHRLILSLLLGAMFLLAAQGCAADKFLSGALGGRNSDEAALRKINPHNLFTPD